MKFSEIINTLKDGNRRFIIFSVLSVLVFLFIWIVGPGNTFRHWIGAVRENRRNLKQIEWYQKEIAAMDERINMLQNDRDTLEKFAREHFGFSAPDEDVYVVE